MILSVFVPFAAGYYLAYLFRTINAVISPALASEFGLDAARAGLLASIYFLAFGVDADSHRGPFGSPWAASSKRRSAGHCSGRRDAVR